MAGRSRVGRGRKTITELPKGKAKVSSPYSQGRKKGEEEILRMDHQGTDSRKSRRSSGRWRRNHDGEKEDGRVKKRGGPKLTGVNDTFPDACGETAKI